jgi:hypothetical protein
MASKTRTKEDDSMKTGQIRFGFLASAVLIAAPILAVGCAAHTSYGYRVYDPGYSDYHVYDRNEEVYYNRWTVETNRPHRDFRKLRDDEKREYWKWRHEHQDHH